MIRKATPSVEKQAGRHRGGRPAAFHRGEVIDGAVDLFWRNGYDGTSLEQIVGELGISRSTLYGSFGGKNGLWQSANDAYLSNLEAVMVEPLLLGRAGLADIESFLDRLSEIIASDEMPSGCLVINAMATATDNTNIRRYTDTFHEGLTVALKRAAARGEIDPESVGPTAAMLLTQLIGLNMAAKAGLGMQTTLPAIEGMRRALQAHPS